MLHCKGSLGTYAAAVQWVEEQLYEKVSFWEKENFEACLCQWKTKILYRKRILCYFSVIVREKMLVLRYICYH